MEKLSDVGKKHGVSISNVASAWVLDHDAVRATIIGARLGETQHRDDNLTALGISFDDEDLAAIGDAIAKLEEIPGDCGDEYRKPPFLTASGDLSHHLNALPPVFAVVEVPGPAKRTRADSGSVWEAKAGFSRAVRDGRQIVVSGTTATTPGGDPVCPGDAEGQTIYILDKILAAIESLGGDISDVIRTRIYLRNSSDWEVVSAAHARIFADVRPANTLFGGVDLIGPYDVEIEADALVRSE